MRPKPQRFVDNKLKQRVLQVRVFSVALRVSAEPRTSGWFTSLRVGGRWRRP